MPVDLLLISKFLFYRTTNISPRLRVISGVMPAEIRISVKSYTRNFLSTSEQFRRYWVTREKRVKIFPNFNREKFLMTVKISPKIRVKRNLNRISKSICSRATFCFSSVKKLMPSGINCFLGFKNAPLQVF